MNATTTGILGKAEINGRDYLALIERVGRENADSLLALRRARLRAERKAAAKATRHAVVLPVWKHWSES